MNLAMNLVRKFKKLSCTVFILFFLFTCIKKSNSSNQYKIPDRVISLGTVLTEEIYLLDAQTKLIANTIYCVHPPDAVKKEKIGNVVEINIEKIISLKPDMVLATSLNYPKDIEKLRRFNINVQVFIQPVSYNELCSEFLRLGRLLDKIDRAESIVAESNKKMESIKEKLKNKIKKKVFVQIGANPLFTVNKESFINDLIEFSGGINIAKESSIGPYSREKVIVDNPDIIIIATMGIVGEEEKKIWSRYKSMNAVKNGKIYLIEPYYVCSANPVSFPQTLEDIAKMINPDIFQ